MPDWLTNLPTWLTDILRQSGMVVILGLAVWYLLRLVEAKEVRLETRFDAQQQAAAEREDNLRKEVRDDRDAEIQRFREAQRELTEANGKLLASKDDRIAALTGELERLRKEIAALTKKLSG